eukprot:2323445-Prymnesium_polylepis.1
MKACGSGAWFPGAQNSTRGHGTRVSRDATHGSRPSPTRRARDAVGATGGGLRRWSLRTLLCSPLARRCVSTRYRFRYCYRGGPLVASSFGGDQI